MVGHGEVHHACGALLLGQLQTGAVPVLEHSGLGVLVCDSLELCAHRHSRQVGNSAAVLQSDLCIGDLEFIRRSNELRLQIHIMVGHGEVHHACGALLLGQLQTGAVPVLEHAGLGVLVCGGLELCTHGHSLQVGNIAAILQENLCIEYLELIGLGHNIGTYLFGGNSLIVVIRSYPDVHIVTAGGGGNRLALVGAVQPGHLRVGIVVICAGVFHLVRGSIVGKVLSLGRVADRLLTQLNRTGLVLFAFLCNDGSLIAAKHVRIRYLVGKDLALVYTGKAFKFSRELANTFHIGAGHRVVAVIVHVDLKVILLKALKGQLSGYGVSIRQLFNDAVVVIVILHIKPDVVGACLGGHFFRSGQPIICSAVLKGSLRNRIAEILRAVVACSTVLEVKAEVRACRPILPCTLTDQKFTALVQRALFGTDVHLIAAVLGFGREVVELLVVVGTHIDEAQLTHALLIAGNDRVLRSPANRKVALLQGREGQLFAVRDSIGVHFVLGAIVVVTIIHHDVNAVSACLGGLRHRRERAILRDIPDRIQRCIVKIHRAFIGCSLGLGVIRKVVELRLISAYHLADIKRAFCVLVALLRYDALLVDAI